MPAHASEKIAIFPFQHSSGVSDDVRTQVENFVVQAFVAERRFEVLERSQFSALEAERSFQMAMTEEQRQAIDELGARFTVIGSVTQSSVDQDALDGGGVAYKVTISYGLRIVDVGNGKVVYSGEFSSSTGSMKDLFAGVFRDSTSLGGALKAALNSTAKPLAAFIDQSFPITAKLVSVERVGRKGEVLEVLINAGPADGVAKKTRLQAFVRKEIDVDGETITREQPVAELEVLRDEGPDLSVCKVRSGGGQLAASIERGATVHVKVQL